MERRNVCCVLEQTGDGDDDIQTQRQTTHDRIERIERKTSEASQI